MDTPDLLFKAAKGNINSVLKFFNTGENGLSETEAENRLSRIGYNTIAKKKKISPLLRLLYSLMNPLIVLLIIIAVISFALGNLEAGIIIVIMIIISTFMTIILESRSNAVAEKLQELIYTTTRVMRNGIPKDISLTCIVPGDIIQLSAGDIIPADIRIIFSKELYINQSTLTGESIPVEKSSKEESPENKNPLELGNICYMGSYVSSGTAIGVVILTGGNTLLGKLAINLSKKEAETSFDIGIRDFTWLMIRFMAIASLLVFLIIGLIKGDWLNALLFSLAVIIALTPEMLPMILTVNLSKGALTMSKEKVIIKHLNAIQNLGAMNLLCSDKTGTLTQNRVILEKHIDIDKRENEEILAFAYINSYFQSGLKNLLDQAIIEHISTEESRKIQENYKKIDEIPFDFIRRRLSVIVEDENKKRLLICKGAVEEVLQISNRAALFGEKKDIIELSQIKVNELVKRLNEDGFRVLTIAYKELPKNKDKYSVLDENNLIIIGFAAFLDPPKEIAREAIEELNKLGVEIKILTGDNEIITKKICKEVCLNIKGIITGSEIEKLSDKELIDKYSNFTIFAKLSPIQKERIICIFRKTGNVVGYLGDGINDAPALKAADVGVSVNTAVDIAKESADVILLEKSLLVLSKGVVEGRKVFGNVLKYIKTRASLSIGNTMSIIGSSLFLPFLPLLPLQLIINNLLNDFCNVMFPTDKVDKEFLLKPRHWEIHNIRKFMLSFGPIISLFDYITFFILIFFFSAWTNPPLFHTGWFVELLSVQILTMYIVRTNKIPFIQSKPSESMLLVSLLTLTFGLFLPYSPLAEGIGFIILPNLYWPVLIIILITYLLISQLTKKWYLK